VELGDRLWASLDAPNRNFTGKTSLIEMAGILSLGDLILANDSGPLHVAVALERPVVAPFFLHQTKPDRTLRSCRGNCLDAQGMPRKPRSPMPHLDGVFCGFAM